MTFRNALQHSFLANAALIPPPSCGGETRLSDNFKVVGEGVMSKKNVERRAWVWISR